MTNKKPTRDLVIISSALNCQPVLDDVVLSIKECLGWRNSYGIAMAENDSLRVKMQEAIKEGIESGLYSAILEKEKLKVEFEKLKTDRDNIYREKEAVRMKSTTPQKGFWDFMYRVFKLV